MKKVTFTAQEILDQQDQNLCVWENFCNLRGINEWAVNEGLMDTDEEFYFTLEEAKEIGLNIDGKEIWESN